MTLGLVLLLALSAGVLFLLPLVPSLREIKTKTDALAITVSREERIDTRHFAQHFREVVQATLGSTIDAVHEANQAVLTELAEGEMVVVVPSGYVHADAEPTLAATFGRVMAAAGDLQLAEGVEYLREVFSRGTLRVGRGARIRAACADQDLVLGPQAVAERWIHAARQLHVESGAAVYGRASADDSIVMEVPSGFARLRAPTIEIGARSFEDVWRAPRIPLEDLEPKELPGLEDQTAGRLLIRGDLDLPASRNITGSLVVHGDLHVREGTRIQGSVKVHGKVTLGEGARIDGSLVAIGDVRMSAGARVAGPLLSEADVRIAQRCKIGDVLRPTTVRAQRIRIGRGSVVHGAMWASLKGVVES